MAEYFKGFFPGWSHSANLSWASKAENGSPPQRHHTACGHRGGRLKSNHEIAMAEKITAACVITDSKHNPVYVRPHTHKVLMETLANDTHFLASHTVMDYSLLMGFDDDTKEVVIGIIGNSIVALPLTPMSPPRPIRPILPDPRPGHLYCLSYA